MIDFDSVLSVICEAYNKNKNEKFIIYGKTVNERFLRKKDGPTHSKSPCSSTSPADSLNDRSAPSVQSDQALKNYLKLE
jgi:hypothetical protein